RRRRRRDHGARLACVHGPLRRARLRAGRPPPVRPAGLRGPGTARRARRAREAQAMTARTDRTEDGGHSMRRRGGFAMAAGNPRFATRARRWLAGAVLAAVAELAAGPAGALSITLAPATVAPLPGGAFALDLVVSDLGGAALGAYDVALTFDPTAVA